MGGLITVLENLMRWLARGSHLRYRLNPSNHISSHLRVRNPSDAGICICSISSYEHVSGQVWNPIFHRGGSWWSTGVEGGRSPPPSFENLDADLEKQNNIGSIIPAVLFDLPSLPSPLSSHRHQIINILPTI